MTKFETINEVPECKSRLHCLACRGRTKFLEIMKSKYSLKDTTCPLNIPLDAKFSDMPQEVKEARMKMNEERNKIIQDGGIVPNMYPDQFSNKITIDNAFILLKDIKNSLNEEKKELVDKLYNSIFTHNKKVEYCVFGGEKVGFAEEVCCGGTVKKVDEFSCEKHEKTTERKCRMCPNFSLKV